MHPWCWLAVILTSCFDLDPTQATNIYRIAVFASVRLLSLSILSSHACLDNVPATCRIEANGNLETLLLWGTVLTSTGLYENGHVLVQEGKITSVGAGIDINLVPSDATVIDWKESVISPGFVNLHEHIAFSTINPFPDIGQKVKHRHDWRVGARNNTPPEC